jgi:polyphosphate kinase
MRVSDEVMKQDILLHFPYHSFDPVIELLREAAMDEHVQEIKITAYRLAENSKVINSLVNAARNGKMVTVMLELRARFDEEANLEWKEKLEEEGIRVLIGVNNIKVHAKICVIKKRVKNKTIQYGFVSTGNLNEDTSRLYGDHSLLTANRNIMADINRIFNFLEHPIMSRLKLLRQCKSLVVCPTGMRNHFKKLIVEEIKQAMKGEPASITLKMNSLSDQQMIDMLAGAAKAGVEVKLLVRGIFCLYSESKKYKIPVKAISIVDQYLEHSRVLIFHNKGKEKVYLSSADWMVRNLDHRIESAVEITNDAIKQELKDCINIQLRDNVKARVLDNEMQNQYVRKKGKSVRSQVDIYNYLYQKTLK